MIAEQVLLPQRRAALAAYAILDTDAEQAFDDITALAAEVLGVPIALISLVDESRQWFKSELGLGCRQTEYGASICAHALQADSVFQIEDLQNDPRTVGNRLVTGEEGMRFYAGAVLRTSEGIPIGTVCVLDRRPRRLDAQQCETLLRLGRQTMALLELRRALLQAKAFERARSHYMATAGHDLRQPLQTIMASIEIALRRPDPAAIQKPLGHAMAAVERLGKELDQLAHAGAAKDVDVTDVVFERFRIDEIFDALMPAWLMQTAAKGLRLDLKSVPGYVRSDRRLLSSIIGNLVGNAIKYTQTGSVTVACRVKPDTGIEVSVTDTGIGMSKADRDTIFAPFKQLDSRSDGLGLGLSLVKGAADYLHYKIRVSSSVGIGSRFSFVIPADSRVDDPKSAG